jgi:peptidoglycan/xylan/chitin deacetylase (PgdA/CDA1 family)
MPGTGSLDRIVEKLETAYCRLRYTKLVRSAPRRGVITFTFDDFPGSALHVGGRILMDHGVRGTYYVSMSLEGVLWHGRPGWRSSDLEKLLEDGHELGCHTYSHIDCRTLTQDELSRDLELNKKHYQPFLRYQTVSSFAYPFGLINARAKRVVADHFATARHIRPGINHTLFDLAELRANAITPDLPLRTVRNLIRRCQECKGWLILFTHDVDLDPSPWGCSPAYFESTVSAAVSSLCDVLPMRNALGAMITREVVE